MHALPLSAKMIASTNGLPPLRYVLTPASRQSFYGRCGIGSREEPSI